MATPPLALSFDVDAEYDQQMAMFQSMRMGDSLESHATHMYMYDAEDAGDVKDERDESEEGVRGGGASGGGVFDVEEQEGAEEEWESGESFSPHSLMNSGVSLRPLPADGSSDSVNGREG